MTYSQIELRKWTQIPWWIRVVLWFRRPIISYDPGFDAYVVFKTFRGRIYVVGDGSTSK